MFVRYVRCLAWVAVAAATGAAGFPAQTYKDNLPLDDPAIRYFRTATHDPAKTRLSTVEAGPDASGYLQGLLDQLGINVDSQMLVFSKTSFQASKISPSNPRAIYFNDDVAVGYVRGSNQLEVAALDPALGPVFYEATFDSSGQPKLDRNTACLQCHLGPNTSGVPGLYIGSVIPNPSGTPLRGDSAIITDHRSDFKERWGGWYVTARSGEQPDRANAVAMNPSEPETLERDSQQNLTTLAGRFDPKGYLTGSSDIVALMTFEHQTQMVNWITRVGWQSRMKRDPDIEDLVAYMLFADEAPLTEPIQGVSTFTATFQKRGPRDHRGRSLRDFDLTKRLFRYPLSYMIYSSSFDGLPVDVRNRIYARLHDILTGEDQRPRYAYLTGEDRQAILDILRETKSGLPAGW
jgi:hypothetical protein